MFIGAEANPKTRAPEERKVVTVDSHQQHSAPPELRKPCGPLTINISPGLVIVVGHTARRTRNWGLVTQGRQ